MTKQSFRLLLVPVLVCLLYAGMPAQAADNYVIDGTHAGVTFKISHLGLSYVYGRFNDFSGGFTLDGPQASFNLAIKVDAIDTNNKKRDEHLLSPDFFNAKQFPTISFKSKEVMVSPKNGYVVTGDFTMHGVTKPITLKLTGGKEAEFPKGVKRVGFSTELTIKRSEFGMNKFLEAIGDEVMISISFEGVKK